MRDIGGIFTYGEYFGDTSAGNAKMQLIAEGCDVEQEAMLRKQLQKMQIRRKLGLFNSND